MEKKEEIVKELTESIEVKQRLREDPACIGAIVDIAEAIIDCYKNKGKVLFMGNGGSAADSQHLACEFVSKFKLERKSLPSIALSVNTSVLTAIGNDYEFERIFARQVESFAETNDVVIGISTSGNSRNVILALEEAKRKGAKTVSFIGSKESKMAEISDLVLKVPSTDTPRIQEAHITAGHIICSIVESELFA